MRARKRLGLLALFSVAMAPFVGCTSVSLPQAKGYSVIAGDRHYYAKSVKIHGNWVEMETDKGPVWASGVVITPLD